MFNYIISYYITLWYIIVCCIVYLASSPTGAGWRVSSALTALRKGSRKNESRVCWNLKLVRSMLVVLLCSCLVVKSIPSVLRHVLCHVTSSASPLYVVFLRACLFELSVWAWIYVDWAPHASGGGASITGPCAIALCFERDRVYLVCFGGLRSVLCRVCLTSFRFARACLRLRVLVLPALA